MSEAIKHNILFVDDDSDFLATLRDLYEMMSEHSWQIFTATSANKALEALDAERIDLVVVDVNMPGMTGIELQCELLNSGVCIPTIVITATDDKGIAARAASNARWASGRRIRYTRCSTRCMAPLACTVTAVSE